MSTQAGLVTVEEFLKLPPAKGGHYELHHGEVILVTAPKWGHHRIQKRVELVLNELIGADGEVSIEVSFQPTPEHEVWVADVAFVRAERINVVGDDEYLQGAPELVVEVLSPSNTVAEMNDKMSICMENGCSCFWVVDPKRQVVSVTEGNVTRHYGVSASIPCDLAGGEIAVREIFE